MFNETVVDMGYFTRILDQTPRPLAPGVKQALIGLLPHFAGVGAQKYRDSTHQALCDAQENAPEAASGAERQRSVVEKLQGRLDGLPQGAAWAGAFCLFCFAVCFGAEVLFNAEVLAWLVSVPKDSVLGLALAIAPATAPVILERVFVVLFGVEKLDRWLRQKAFYLAVGVLTLAALFCLGLARGVASILLNNPEAIALTGSQQKLIDLTLVLVSISLAVSGALFYLQALAAIRGALARWRAGRELAREQKRLAVLEGACAAARASIDHLRHKWETVGAAAEKLAQRYIAEGMVVLAQWEARPVSPRDQVASRLGTEPPSGSSYATSVN